MASSSYDIDVARARIERVFRYLAELHRIRTPPALDLDRYEWILRLDALPRHGTIQRGFAPLDAADGGDPPSRSGFIVAIERPAETECPAPSVLFENWLEAGWEQPGVTPSVAPTRTHKTTNREESFEAKEERVLAFESWLDERRRWEASESQVIAAARLFSELFTLWGKFERESEKLQLFIGDGVLVASHGGETVRHPVLLQRVQLEFDAGKPRFTIRETGDPPDLYAPLLRYLDVDPKRLLALKQEVADDEIHPLGGKPTSAFLQRMVQTLWRNGMYFDAQRDVGKPSGPYVYRQPAFYLGNRNQGFADTIERYIEILPHTDDLPEALLRIVGIETGRGSDRRPTESIAYDLLLTRDANREQKRVIHRLDETGAVLVQGPPGTGKSHTIANLIGHLLAQGKTILVTSHASKALRIVRDKVARPLQSLCVSLLDSDEESTMQLEESITGILNYFSSTTRGKLDKDIERLTRTREGLRAEQDAVRAQLLRAITDEHTGLPSLGEAVAPAEAARRVRQAAGVHDWIPAPVSADLPLSVAEILELYRLNGRVSESDEDLLDAERPAVTDLPTPREVAALLDEVRRIDQAKPGASPKLWAHDQQTAESLAELEQVVRGALAALSDDAPWIRECLEVGRRGADERAPWLALCEEVRRAAHEIPLRDELILAHAPVIESTRPRAELLAACRELIGHLDAGKKVGRTSRLFNGSWGEVLRTCKVEGGEPRTVEHFHALVAALEVDAMRDSLARRWDHQLDGTGAPAAASLGKKPEKKAAELTTQIWSALNWHEEVWLGCLAAFTRSGLQWDRIVVQVAPAAGPHGETARIRAALDKVGPIIAERKGHVRARDLAHTREQWIDGLKGFSTTSAAYPLVKLLRNALRTGDYDAYVEGHTRLREVEAIGDDVARRRGLLDRLEAAAPAWAAVLRKRAAPHQGSDPPGSLEEALGYRLLDQALVQLHTVDLEELLAQLARIDQKLQETTARYVEVLAWRSQFARTALKQQQALSGWLALHKKIGKGTGKRVGRLKEEARKTLVECRGAVPVWIMPLSRVVESFDIATTRFDVVIIDEASQSDVVGLVAFAMGKEIAVVGDHEQVSPYAVGYKTEAIAGLIDETLTDIPNKQLYDGRTSVYDLARQSFGGTIRLLEHFRCVPSIIQFSNQLCYSGEVRPLREAAAAKIGPALVSVHVEGGASVDRVNEKEAQVVASLVAAICRFPEYEDCTIGVISMVGTENALLIDSILRRRLTVTEYQKRRLLCGNAFQFQGDERDVMFLSMVDSPADLPLPLRQRDEARKVFNVAASRARDQLWLVHSLQPGRDLKAGDLRLRLIEHVEAGTPARAADTDLATVLFDSELQGELCRILEAEGYRVVPRYTVGGHAIDVVVHGAGNARVGILCDGGRALPDQDIHGVLEHQMILERLGWKLIRIRASEYFRDPKKELERLRRRLGARGIKPLEADRRNGRKAKAKDKPEPTGPSLHERVIQRAESIRSRWNVAIPPRPTEIAGAGGPAREG
ncbi:MAG TPA: AAA domain-containing protein [Kofleriaceae bacterium]|nr:AAA domain-containing protein [Kofleriaceae bacterium]